MEAMQFDTPHCQPMKSCSRSAPRDDQFTRYNIDKDLIFQSD
jgi:hypothetical protein